MPSARLRWHDPSPPPGTQARIDPSRLGRVLSFYTTLTMLVVPLGLLLAGPAAERTGVAPWFAISGDAIAVAACAVEPAPSVRALRRVAPGDAPAGEAGPSS